MEILSPPTGVTRDQAFAWALRRARAQDSSVTLVHNQIPVRVDPLDTEEAIRLRFQTNDEADVKVSQPEQVSVHEFRR